MDVPVFVQNVKESRSSVKLLDGKRIGDTSREEEIRHILRHWKQEELNWLMFKVTVTVSWE